MTEIPIEIKKIPLCRKCDHSVIVRNDDGFGFKMISCKKDKNIQNYSDAKKFCPAIREKAKNE